MRFHSASHGVHRALLNHQSIKAKALIFHDAMCVCFTLQTIKVTVTSPNATVANPVLVYVNQLRGVTSWQIPFVDKELVSIIYVCMCI